MEESSPPTVAGAVADLAEASPHSHVVDLATNEPERVYISINFGGVNMVGRRRLFLAASKSCRLDGHAAYPDRGLTAHDLRNRMAALERFEQPDNLARCDEPYQPSDIQEPDAANDGRGEAASASQERRGCEQREFTSAVGANQGESQDESQNKRCAALRQQAKNGRSGCRGCERSDADREAPEHRIAVDRVVQRAEADALVDQPGAGDDEKRRAQGQHRRGPHRKGGK